ncbi:MAG: IS110 family transposase [Candidatus Methylophosphatis roskildensis]
MSTNAPAVVGLDVAKAKVDVALLKCGKFKSKVIDNSPAGFAALMAWLTKQGVSESAFAMEATGTYHEALAQSLVDQGARVFVINPARIKRYAQASMLRGKTDSADARVIAQFFAAQQADLHPWVPPPAEVRRLRELTRRLQALKDLRQQEANRLASASEPQVLGSLNAVLTTLDEQIGAIEGSIHDHIDGHPALKADRDLLASIPGLGPRSIPVLMAELPLRSFESAAQAGAFAGLSPRRFESGQSVKAKTRISKIGAPRLRRTLYFPAIVAAQHNPILHAFYQRLLVNGKTKMAAIVATMRKLIHIAYGVIRSGKPFDPLHLENTQQAG